MTCNEARELLGPFVDAELPSATLLAVARHAAVCAACDEGIRQLTDLHEAVAGAVQGAADGLDLSGVWSRVDAAAAWHDARARRRSRLRALPVWGSVAALAASVFVWVAINGGQRTVEAPRKPRARAYTEIDHLAGRVASFGREPKTGAPIIWVNYAPSSDR